MIDVETRARRAGEAARTEAAALADHLEVPQASARQREARTVRRPLAGALACALVVALIVLLVTELNRPGVPTIEPVAPDASQVVTEPVAVDGVLPVPPVGEVLPAYLEDGTPVFVSHPEDGEVLVLGALSPHVVAWHGKLVGYCPSSQWFEEPRHADRFNAWGDYTGGPAPYALPDHEAVLSADGSTVRVTGEVDHTRSRDDRRAEQPQQGPNCVDEPIGAETLMAHEVPAEVPPLDGTEIPEDRWIWAEVALGGAPGDPRACDLDGRCHAESPRLAVSPGWDNPVPSGARRVALVRDTPDGVLALSPAVVPAAWWDASDLQEGEDGGGSPVSADPLLPLPEPGEAVATWLDDGTPVFVGREEDGTVHVLDATAGERESTLVGWCSSSGSFGDIFGARWTVAGGYVGGPAYGDLRRYPAELVESGETAAVRVTGDLGPPRDRSSAERERGPWCETDELVRHLPGERTRVMEVGFVIGTQPRWGWVRMAIAEVDGDLLLCARAGLEGCGRPDAGPEPDPTNADCVPDIGPAGLCPPEQDPVVVTEGISPTDGPELLLVRGSPDGRTVEVRQPAEFDGG